MSRVAVIATVAFVFACGTRTPPRDVLNQLGGGAGGGAVAKDAGTSDPRVEACKMACPSNSCTADGFCVVTPQPGDMKFRCPDGVACEIDCRAADSCQIPVSCGDGDCRVVCGGPGAPRACTDIVECRDAKSCDIKCLGDNSCGAIFCGMGRCTAQCGTDTVTGACMRGLDCPNSCSCSVTCALGNCSGTSCPMGCRPPAGTKGCIGNTAQCDTCN